MGIYEPKKTASEKHKSIQKAVIDYCVLEGHIKKTEKKAAKKYHFVKHTISILVSKDFSGVPKPESKKGSSNSVFNPKNCRGTFKINGRYAERTDFINYPKSCFNDQLKLNFLIKQLNRGKITETVFEDLKSVLYIPEKEAVISESQIRKEKAEKTFREIDNAFSKLSF